MKAKFGTKFLLAVSLMAATSAHAQVDATLGSRTYGSKEWRQATAEAAILTADFARSCVCFFYGAASQGGQCALYLLALDEADEFASAERVKCEIAADNKHQRDKFVIETRRADALLPPAERSNPGNPFEGTSVMGYFLQAHGSLSDDEQMFLLNADYSYPATREIAISIRREILFRMDGLINEKLKSDIDKCWAQYTGFKQCATQVGPTETPSVNE